MTDRQSEASYAAESEQLEVIIPQMRPRVLARLVARLALHLAEGADHQTHTKVINLASIMIARTITGDELPDLRTAYEAQLAELTEGGEQAQAIGQGLESLRAIFMQTELEE